MLLNYGADPHIKSVTGHKPIDLVTDIKIYDLLLDYEKNVGITFHTNKLLCIVLNIYILENLVLNNFC